MKRLEDWPERLAAYVDAHRDTPFRWGQNDCATFAAGAVEAITGHPMEVPIVESAQDYARFVADLGALREHAADHLGAPLASPAFARRGDVVLMLLDGRETLGVCIGVEAAAPGASGVLTVPMSAASAAWRV